MKNEPFVIERHFNAPIGKVWKALTDKDQMKKWYFDLDEFKPEIDFEFQFWGENEGRKYLHLCRITSVVFEEKISYTWKYRDYPGESEVTFELFQEGETTRLKLTHAGLETFPANEPDFRRESFSGGWTYLIGTALKNFVE
ncbi:Uncharacterized conserved protein YndB, AHSA1/START domain [Pseudarcicella hirudinis]|uniref:Uncharacterized conserved protein YndB, AHSA1/START domain n=1 Tax=Pseudarcicella hirudinis TaxID=1079859 RepID=A0A1I5MQM5_9BACT|nr:SRPBCC domain-containing protein [Pseudarcicella hirudinis]SFP11888.1 Uncharacterized conserved protein YndB, AHSA1/START domain [Pseudarcicella hirudinis]